MNSYIAINFIWQSHKFVISIGKAGKLVGFYQVMLDYSMANHYIINVNRGITQDVGGRHFNFSHSKVSIFSNSAVIINLSSTASISNCTFYNQSRE